MTTLEVLKNEVAQGTIELVHTALTREHNGYVSTKVMETEPEYYSGQYGVGFTTYENNRKSTRYCWKNYYIYKNSAELKALEEIKKLDKKLVSLKELESIESMPEIAKTENLGTSGVCTGAYWYDVQLQDGSNIDLYVR